MVLAVFWVTAGTSGGLPTNFMFEGGFLLCAALAALVVADARLVEPGRFARGLAWGPLHFIGTISYGIYLWHWPVIVYLNGARTGLSTWPLNLVRIVVTLAVSTASYYLVERPIRLARFRGGVRVWGPGRRRRHCRGRSSSPPFRPWPIPPASWGRRISPRPGSGQAVPGAGGYAGQQPIQLAPAPSAADPLRVMILGDSVMHDASYGITAALRVHRRGHGVPPGPSTGSGSTTATGWPTSIPNLVRQTGAQLIVASWSWDQYGPTTPNALHQPVQYTEAAPPSGCHHVDTRATVWRG